MIEDTKVNVIRLHFHISSASQFRSALSRLRILENAPLGSAGRRERDALELAVSRYLALSHDRKDSSQMDA